MADQTELEKVLDVFNVEKYKTSDSRILEYTGDTSNPSIERIVKHLGRAIIKDDKLLNQMLMEEQMADQWNRHQERSRNAEKGRADAEKVAKIAVQQKNDADKARDDAQKKLMQQKINADKAKADADKAKADAEKEANELRKRIEFLEQQARSNNKNA